MPVRMAIQINCHRQGSDMAGCNLNMNCQGCRLATQTGGTDAGLIKLLQQFTFKGCPGWFGMRAAKVTEESFLRQQGTGLKVTADTDPHYDGRTGIAAGFDDGVQDK